MRPVLLLKQIAAHTVLIVFLLIFIAPLVWMVGGSFKPPRHLFDNIINPIPLRPSLANYLDVFERTDIPKQLLNSLIFAGGVTLGQILIAIPAAYAFVRAKRRIFEAIFAVMILSLSIPFVVVYVPDYIMVARANLIDTYVGLIIPAIVNTQGAYGIFLLRQHFGSFPEEIIDAARVDGCTEMGVLRHIVVPSNRSGIAAMAIYVFIQAWNEYIWPLLITSSAEKHVITVGITTFANAEGGFEWGNVMTAATLASVPTILLYVALRRQVMSAFVEGGLK